MRKYWLKLVEFISIGQMGQVHHSAKRPILAGHVSRSGGTGIVSLFVVSCYPVTPLLILFTQEGDQICRSVIFLY